MSLHVVFATKKRSFIYFLLIRGNRICRNIFLSALIAMGPPLQWRHNGHENVSNHQPHDCLLNRSSRSRSKKTSKLRVTGLCVGNSPGTGEFPAQMASNAENVSIWSLMTSSCMKTTCCHQFHQWILYVLNLRYTSNIRLSIFVLCYALFWFGRSSVTHILKGTLVSFITYLTLRNLRGNITDVSKYNTAGIRDMN